MSFFQSTSSYQGTSYAAGKWLHAVYLLSRLSIAFLFLYAAANKLSDLNGFIETIFAFGFVPEGLAPIGALVVLGVEIVASVLLVFDRKGGLLLLTLLTLFFLGVLGYAIWAGLDIDCGCFGANDPAGDALAGLRISFFRDLVLIAAFAFIQWLRNYLHIQPKPFLLFQ